MIRGLFQQPHCPYLPKSGSAEGEMKLNITESKGDHGVQVMEVLLDRVEQLESRVNGEGTGRRKAGP